MPTDQISALTVSDNKSSPDDSLTHDLPVCPASPGFGKCGWLVWGLFVVAGFLALGVDVPLSRAMVQGHALRRLHHVLESFEPFGQPTAILAVSLAVFLCGGKRRGCISIAGASPARVTGGQRHEAVRRSRSPQDLRLRGYGARHVPGCLSGNSRRYGMPELSFRAYDGGCRFLPGALGGFSAGTLAVCGPRRNGGPAAHRIRGPLPERHSVRRQPGVRGAPGRLRQRPARQMVQPVRFANGRSHGRLKNTGHVSGLISRMPSMVVGAPMSSV